MDKQALIQASIKDIPPAFLDEGRQVESLMLFEITDASGDTKIMWDSRNPDEVEHAKKTFEDLTAKGFTAFKVNEKTHEKDEMVRTFDPQAQRYIFVGRNVGG